MEQTYNGWTNYATWRVNLEIFDGMSPSDVTGRSLPAVSELKDALKDYAEGLIYESGGGDGNLAVDYAMAFLSDVDWWSIANHMLADYAERIEEVKACLEANGALVGEVEGGFVYRDF